MGKKYEVTDIRHPVDPTMYRIRALRDLGYHDVYEGDLGGYVDSEDNLSHRGECWIGEDACVDERARVTGNALVEGRVLVTDYARVGGNAYVGGSCVLSNSSTVSGDAYLDGAVEMSGRASVSGNAEVHGSAQLTDEALVRTSAHALHALVHGSGVFGATLTRQRIGHLLHVGCWSGTVDEFEDMIRSDKWVTSNAATRELRRPELLAFAAMCRARLASWKVKEK